MDNVQSNRIRNLLAGKTDIEKKDQSLVAKLIKEKTLLITGAAGSVGSELCRQVAQFEPSLLLFFDQNESGIFYITREIQKNFPSLHTIGIIGDIKDEEKIKNLFEKYHPTIIFHAAAYKHVPLMELQPDEAVKNNIFGTKVVAEAAKKYHAEKFIFVSTDKTIKPTSIMGATKRVGEMICQSLNQDTKTSFASIRFGNIVGSRGSVIPIFKRQIERRAPIEITHPEMQRFFMTVHEASFLMLEAASMMKGGEIFVFEMGESIKILDLAKEMIRLAGLEPGKDIPFVFTNPRPGEKISEEYLTHGQEIFPTSDPKIFTIHVPSQTSNELEKNLDLLRSAVITANNQRIADVLKILVPSCSLNGKNSIVYPKSFAKID